MNQEKISSFWTTLFNPNDKTCFGLNKFGTSLSNVEAAKVDAPRYRDLQYFAINSMEGEGRADANVTSHRNFLVEFDKIPREEQMKAVKKLGMPYSTVTFSGSKSLHFIISLEEALLNRNVYDFAVEWLYNILTPYGVDTQTSNPSRFSRVPGGTNEKIKYKLGEDGKPLKEANGKSVVDEIIYSQQKLLEVVGRVPNNTLQDWLLLFPDHQPVPITYDQVKVLSDKADPSLLPNWTKYLLEHGINNGKRNSEVYRMGFDFITAGFNLEEAISYFSQHAKQLGDFTLGEGAEALTSAYKTYMRRQGNDNQ